MWNLQSRVNLLILTIPKWLRMNSIINQLYVDVIFFQYMKVHFFFFFIIVLLLLFQNSSEQRWCHHNFSTEWVSHALHEKHIKLLFNFFDHLKLDKLCQFVPEKVKPSSFSSIFYFFGDGRCLLSTNAKQLNLDLQMFSWGCKIEA